VLVSVREHLGPSEINIGKSMLTGNRVRIDRLNNMSVTRELAALGAAVGLTLLGVVFFLAGNVTLQVLTLSVIMFIVSGLCVRAALSANNRRERVGWYSFAACFLLFALYSVGGIPYGERLSSEFSISSAALRLISVAGYLFCLFGLAIAVRVPRGIMARLLLDTFVVLLGGIVITVEILQHTSLATSSLDPTTRMLYRPLGDLSIISFIAIALASMPNSARLYPALKRGMAAMGCLLVGHLGASTAIMRGLEHPSGWVYVAYAGAGLLFASAAFIYIETRASATETVSATLVPHNPLTHSFWFHLGNAVVPYTVSMSAATLLFIRALDPESTGTGMQLPLVGAIAFIAIGGLRHILSHSETRSLYKHMAVLNRDLEHVVDQRTAELVRRNEELEAVHRVAMVSAVSLDLKVILQSVAEQLTHAVGASTCVIYERKDDGLSVIARHDRGNGVTTARLRDPSMTLANVRATDLDPAGSRTSIVKRWDIENDTLAAEVLDYYGSSTAMIVPLLAGDQTVGIAEIYRTRPEEFGDEEISLAEAVTTHAALASENAQAYSRSQFAANHDQVTGLLNHRALHEELSVLFDQSVKLGRPITVIMMDLNFFKQFNDRYGHQAGDGVLAEIGRSIRHSVPATAISARYGGDEFTVAIPDCPVENATIFVKTIRESVDRIQDRHGFVSEGFGMAFGVASYPEDGTNLSEIIAMSDERMYADKWRLKGFSDRRSNRLHGAPSGAEATSTTGVKL
jgi:diguanylate cyclase (GGDEF)-like protein